MIFKRKQPKPAGIGGICVIKTNIINKMVQEQSYINRSVSYIKEIEQDVIRRQDIRKGRSNNEILAADQLLVYVANKSLFKGVVEVIPLSIRRDSPSGAGIISLLNKKKTFLMRLDSLLVASDSELSEHKNNYRHGTQMFIEKNICNENIYNKPEFSWVSR